MTLNLPLNSRSCCEFQTFPPISYFYLLTSTLRLDIFDPHRHQCGLEINMTKLRESLTLPHMEQRHPVLMNAIFLWACFVSRPGPLYQHEAHYLSRTLESLGEALQQPGKVVDIVQASSLLSMYFFSNGRMLEGSYHANAAASLAVQFGLHCATSRKNSRCFDPTESFKVESGDEIEQNERTLAFWQAYNLDSCWSVVLRKSPIIRDARITVNSINPLPPPKVDEYEMVIIPVERPSILIDLFLL
jgi:hypothetical protein